MKKNVLILGSGGREHALTHKISQSTLLGQLFAVPGNPGIAELAMILPGSLNDFESIRQLIIQYDINIVICGPEIPLAEGLMDFLDDCDLPEKPILIGPKKAGALLESSKSYSKDFMLRHGIPTAAYKSFSKDQIDEAMEFMGSMFPPIVLKASGLAAGKGVLICPDHMNAETELLQMFSGKFGTASDNVVIEEFLSGIEFSVFILCNNSRYILLPEAKDYKRIGERDTGLNTGGMGAVSPVPFVSPELMQKVTDRIILPTLSGLQKDGIEYKGFIFFGLIVVNDEPYLIEYNCRMGDPETEVVMPRLQSDLLELIMALENKSPASLSIEVDPRTAVTVMMVSKGYPGDYEKAKPIDLTKVNGKNFTIFHAGTSMDNYQLVSAGGRVLAITSFGAGISEAVKNSLQIADDISFDGKYYRRDIGIDLMNLHNT